MVGKVAAMASPILTTPTIDVEIWSDVVCPWCYIGKRRFEKALAELEGEIEINTTFRPYQLDPRASPGTTQPVFEAYVKKFGGHEQAQMVLDRVTSAAAEDGLAFRMDLALRAHTLLAHRLLWYAEQPGSPVEQGALKERLLQAYFMDGLNIGDPDTLADCAAEVGFDRDDVVDFLDGDSGRVEIREFFEYAADNGISAVPTFVINQQWMIPGAQDPDTFVSVLRRLAEKLRPAPTDDDDNVCTDEACDV